MVPHRHARHCNQVTWEVQAPHLIAAVPKVRIAHDPSSHQDERLSRRIARADDSLTAAHTHGMALELFEEGELSCADAKAPPDPVRKGRHDVPSHGRRM